LGIEEDDDEEGVRFGFVLTFNCCSIVADAAFVAEVDGRSLIFFGSIN